MKEIDFKLVRPADTETIRQIADWYLVEWHIPKESLDTTERNIAVMKFDL